MKLRENRNALTFYICIYWSVVFNLFIDRKGISSFVYSSTLQVEVFMGVRTSSTHLLRVFYVDKKEEITFCYISV